MYGPTKDLKTNEKVMIRIIHMSMRAARESSGFQRKSVLRRSGIEGIAIAESVVPSRHTQETTCGRGDVRRRDVTMRMSCTYESDLSVV